MKSTGIIRRLDELGRLVIPIEIRNKLNISERDPVEIFIDGSNVIVHKYESTCIFCGNPKNLTVYKGKYICTSCAKKIGNASKKQ